MPKINLPAYAVVELLMRLSNLDKKIGDYRGHTVRNGNVMVKTTNGSIRFSTDMVIRQFESPEMIDTDTLARITSLFKAQE